MDIIIILILIGMILFFYQLYSKEAFSNEDVRNTLKKWNIKPDIYLNRSFNFFALDKSERKLLEMNKKNPKLSKIYELDHLKECTLLLTYLEDQILTEIHLQLEFDENIQLQIPFFDAELDNGFDRSWALKEAKNWKFLLNNRSYEKKTIKIT